MSHQTIESLPNRCLVIFESSTCQKCHELIENAEQAKLEIELIRLDENTGGIIGPKFAIMMAPTTLLIEEGREIDRFYGVKTPAAIEEFAK